MKCVKCGEQKGKRLCPALGGDICSACCGTHRLKQIACPADCAWLGGLAVAAGLKEPPAEEVRAAAKDIAEAITAWLSTSRDKQWFVDVALEQVFGDDDPEDGDHEWLMELWLGGLQHGVADERGRRVVDIMLAERARDLPPAQVAVLRSLAKAWFSIFRVVHVDVDQGMRLRDLIDDREIYVHEKLASREVKPLDVVVAFISSAGGVEMFQGVARVPPAHVTPLVDELRTLLDEAGAPDRVAATPHVWGYTVGKLRELVRDFWPALQNTDGEAIYPSKARFDVVDEEIMRRAFAACPDLDADDDGRGWGWRRGDDDGALSLGRLSLEGRRLVLEVNSRERLERGKDLVASLAGAAVRHQLDEHADIDRLMEDARRAGPASRGSNPGMDIPEDVKREVIGEALRRAYANVLDEPVPMLDNLTPRQAADAGGDKRRRVRDWLDGLEQSLESMPGASDAIDVDEWRIELGFEPRWDDGSWLDEEEEDDELDEGAEPDWTALLDSDLVWELAERVDEDARAWLDEPTPLLDGRTPRAAAKEPALRWRVQLLLEGIDECSALEPSEVDAAAAALGLDDTDLVYDPATAPDPETWLRHHWRERETAVRRAHAAMTGKHPALGGEDLERHVDEHRAIESWIARAAHDAPAALDRLCRAGLSRHEALHALGAAFTRALGQSLEAEEEDDDKDDFADAFAALSPDPWRGTAD